MEMTMDHAQHRPSDATDKVRDPVCGMMVDPATAISTGHDGKTYHFCCDGCRDSFVASPDKYLNQKPFELPPRRTAAPLAHDHAHHHHHDAAAPAPSPLGRRASPQTQRTGTYT